MSDILIKDIIQQLHDVTNGDLWIDETFEKKLSGLTEEEAFTRPLPELHSVAELLSHLAVWRRVNIRRLNGEKILMPIDHPDNWKSNETLRPMGWDGLKRDFYASQQEVIAMLQGREDSYLDTMSTHYGKDFRYLLQGLIHHDMYHLGQIGITLKFLKQDK